MTTNEVLDQICNNFWTAHLSVPFGNKCDQIGHFKKFLATNFFPNLAQTLDDFWVNLKTCRGNFLKIWFTFYFDIWSRCWQRQTLTISLILSGNSFVILNNATGFNGQKDCVNGPSSELSLLKGTPQSHRRDPDN